MNISLLQAGLANVAVAGLSIVCAIPLAQRKVKMNRWYGIRVRKTLTSHENWEKINAYGGRALIRWSIPLFLLGVAVIIAAFFIPENDRRDADWILTLTSWSAVILMGALVQITAWMKKLPE